MRIYKPQASAGQQLSALVYFHGGGFVAGGIESHDAICRTLANKTPCIVLSVDYRCALKSFCHVPCHAMHPSCSADFTALVSLIYLAWVTLLREGQFHWACRLAPEHPFPAAVEDCYAAVEWVSANLESLGATSDKLAVGGDSAGNISLSNPCPFKCKSICRGSGKMYARRRCARDSMLPLFPLFHDISACPLTLLAQSMIGAGANLATVSAHTARDRAGPKIVHQLLVYPVVDCPQAEGHFLYNSYKGVLSCISINKPHLGTIRIICSTKSAPLKAYLLSGVCCLPVHLSYVQPESMEA